MSKHSVNITFERDGDSGVLAYNVVEALASIGVEVKVLKESEDEIVIVVSNERDDGQ